jgi:hypothetical protein
MVRLISSLNWLVGFLALAAAFAYPFYHQTTVAAAEDAVSKAVDKIVQAERLERQAPNGKFFYFRTDALPDRVKSDVQAAANGLAANFVYDADQDPGHELIIRAMTSNAGLQAGWPPVLYVYEVHDVSGLPAEGDHAAGEPKKLSGQSVGLLAVLGQIL